MRRVIFAGLAAVAALAFTPAYAQTASDRVQMPDETSLKALTDVRVALVKGALQLNPDQTKLWAPVEQAIRDRAEMRRTRLSKLVAMRSQDKDPDPLEVMRIRADALSERGAALKKLVVAWEPLYQTLDQQQKMRLGMLAAYGLRAVSHVFEQEDEEE